MTKLTISKITAKNVCHISECIEYGWRSYLTIKLMFRVGGGVAVHLFYCYL